MDIETLLHDEAFAKEIDKANNLEEIAQLFNDKGIEVSAADIQKAMDASDNGELNEESLEDVAGGVTPVFAAVGIAAYLIARRWIQLKRGCGRSRK